MDDSDGNESALGLSESTRAYLYRILLALAALAVLYGVATQEEVTQWIGLGAALLGNGMATVHTKR